VKPPAASSIHFGQDTVHFSGEATDPQPVRSLPKTLIAFLALLLAHGSQKLLGDEPPILSPASSGLAAQPFPPSPSVEGVALTTLILRVLQQAERKRKPAESKAAPETASPQMVGAPKESAWPANVRVYVNSPLSQSSAHQGPHRQSTPESDAKQAISEQVAGSGAEDLSVQQLLVSQGLKSYVGTLAESLRRHQSLDEAVRALNALPLPVETSTSTADLSFVPWQRSAEPVATRYALFVHGHSGREIMSRLHEQTFIQALKDDYGLIDDEAHVQQLESPSQRELLHAFMRLKNATQAQPGVAEALIVIDMPETNHTSVKEQQSLSGKPELAGNGIEDWQGHLLFRDDEPQNPMEVDTLKWIAKKFLANFKSAAMVITTQ
jgi:hypothetical protein